MDKSLLRRYQKNTAMFNWSPCRPPPLQLAILCSDKKRNVRTGLDHSSLSNSCLPGNHLRMYEQKSPMEQFQIPNMHSTLQR